MHDWIYGSKSHDEFRVCVNELLFKFMGCDIIAAIRYVKCHYTTTWLADYMYM